MAFGMMEHHRRVNETSILSLISSPVVYASPIRRTLAPVRDVMQAFWPARNAFPTPHPFPDDELEKGNRNRCPNAKIGSNFFALGHRFPLRRQNSSICGLTELSQLAVSVFPGSSILTVKVHTWHTQGPRAAVVPLGRCTRQLPTIKAAVFISISKRIGMGIS
ncbi:hypothetical protein F5148DRAFT_1171863 [Russula earlei]|uniref:Uncharacterized protein n=1 Tax=Russula earlei TaxID=71964 RepID=A0ACC0UJW3_9AGAM|nr:hypothetical protein F5148DRAFT_1171863 [Russula earlei]